MLPFSLKESWQANPLQVPLRGPYGEKYEGWANMNYNL